MLGKIPELWRIGHEATQVKSNYYKKPRRVKVNCLKILMKNQIQGAEKSGDTRKNVAGVVGDVVLSSVEKDVFNHKIWVSDRGASYHQYNNDDGLYDDIAIFEEINVGNGNLMIVEKRVNSAVRFSRKIVNVSPSHLRR
jgi:hypothetical protein